MEPTWHLLCSYTYSRRCPVASSASTPTPEGSFPGDAWRPTMSDWTCHFCTNVIRGRSRAPAYCSRCGHTSFQVDRISPHSRVPGTVSPVPLPDVELRRFSVVSDTPSKPRRERRRAKRVRPKERLEVRLCRIGPLKVVDISPVGLLIEHKSPFAPGCVCEVELWRSGKTVRLRGEVVRTFVATGEGSHAGLRYRSAVQFLETPPAIFELLPELSEESAQQPVHTPAPE